MLYTCYSHTLKETYKRDTHTKRDLQKRYVVHTYDWMCRSVDLPGRTRHARTHAHAHAHREYIHPPSEVVSNLAKNAGTQSDTDLFHAHAALRCLLAWSRRLHMYIYIYMYIHIHDCLDIHTCLPVNDYSYGWNKLEPAPIELEPVSCNWISSWQKCFLVNPKVGFFFGYPEIGRKINEGSV